MVQLIEDIIRGLAMFGWGQLGIPYYHEFDEGENDA
jgi:hypothetical protein